MRHCWHSGPPRSCKNRFDEFAPATNSQLEHAVLVGASELRFVEVPGFKAFLTHRCVVQWSTGFDQDMNTGCISLEIQILPRAKGFLLFGGTPAVFGLLKLRSMAGMDRCAVPGAARLLRMRCDTRPVLFHLAQTIPITLVVRWVSHLC